MTRRDPLPTASPTPHARTNAFKVEVGARAAIVAPMRFEVGWTVSLDGFCVDSIHQTRAEAEAAARRYLEDPECPCWIAKRGES